MPNIIDRLEQFMDSQGINNNQMTVKAGLSVGLIGSARKKRSGLHSDNIEKILRAYPELNPSWLITGRGGMLISTYDKKKEDSLLVIRDPASDYKSLVEELHETIDILKEQLAEAAKDKDLLRRIIANNLSDK
jgi:hypothetical protein